MPLVRDQQRDPVLVAGVALCVALVAFVLAAGSARAAADARGCRAIAFRIDARLGPPAGREDALAAIGEISSLTGIPFVERDRAVLTVTWREPGRRWSGRTLGRTVGSWTTLDGTAQLDSTAVALRSFDASPPAVDWLTVLRHELGHAMGLGHATDPGDLMYPQAVATGKAWSAADRAQLANRGRLAACVR
jgi:hypothetical protein